MGFYMACHAFVRRIIYDELLEKYIMQKDGNIKIITNNTM